eukprot:gnl/MRDRNA2_/MRDRNA2_93547_c0_seq1.p1 gnl/MRDRNA2_/MRDRNA2_93547_c0~~gnl/MRDRNA2_/MRDRNA2_93547_c0_seq1.p1  ORF type:complete len:240 (+),score=64.74 gnl/MRDRNA2_/MRDRNA2_93547_c0_seq1:55-774(+)
MSDGTSVSMKRDCLARLVSTFEVGNSDDEERKGKLGSGRRVLNSDDEEPRGPRSSSASSSSMCLPQTVESVENENVEEHVGKKRLMKQSKRALSSVDEESTAKRSENDTIAPPKKKGKGRGKSKRKSEESTAAKKAEDKAAETADRQVVAVDAEASCTRLVKPGTHYQKKKHVYYPDLQFVEDEIPPGSEMEKWLKSHPLHDKIRRRGYPLPIGDFEILQLRAFTPKRYGGEWMEADEK